MLKKENLSAEWCADRLG